MTDQDQLDAIIPRDRARGTGDLEGRTIVSSFLFEVMGLDPNHAFTNPYVADDETGRPTEYCGIRTTGAVGSPCGYPRSMHRPDPRDPDPLHVEATYQDGWEDVTARRDYQRASAALHSKDGAS